MINRILERLEEERDIAYADFYEYLMKYELDNDFDEDDDLDEDYDFDADYITTITLK